MLWRTTTGLSVGAEAIKLLEELAESPEKSDARDARLRMASIEYAGGRKVEAHRAVDALIGERPGYASARAMKARMLLRDGAPAREALTQAREAVKADPYLPRRSMPWGSRRSPSAIWTRPQRRSRKR